jgi:hypothetical protein
MSTANTPEPVSGKRVVIDAPRLWGGGLATAVVAALVASVGVLVCRDLLHDGCRCRTIVAAALVSDQLKVRTTMVRTSRSCNGLREGMISTLPLPAYAYPSATV